MRRIIALLTTSVLLVSVLAACSKPLSTLSATELLEIGEKYLLELDYEQALVQFLKVIEVEPMNPRGYTGAADSYSGLGQQVESINIVRSGIQTINEIGKSEPLFVWLVDFGDLMFVEDKFDISALAYEAIIAENPQAEYAYKLAQVYIASGDIDKAIELLRRIADLLNDDDLRWEADRLEQLSNDGSAVGLIRIIGVSPQSALAGQETTYSVAVRYASANADGCIIYAGANTDESMCYRLYDEYILPNTYGVYTFQFTCVPATWPDAAFGIYVNISAHPHPESWTPFGSDIYDLQD